MIPFNRLAKSGVQIRIALLMGVHRHPRTSSNLQGVVVQQHDNNFFVFQVSCATIVCSAKRRQALLRSNLSRDNGTNGNHALALTAVFPRFFKGVFDFFLCGLLLLCLKKTDADLFFDFAVGLFVGSKRN